MLLRVRYGTVPAVQRVKSRPVSVRASSTSASVHAHRRGESRPRFQPSTSQSANGAGRIAIACPRRMHTVVIVTTLLSAGSSCSTSSFPAGACRTMAFVAIGGTYRSHKLVEGTAGTSSIDDVISRI